MFQKSLIWPECSRSRAVFAGSAVQSFERFAHHQKFLLAIFLENPGVALAQHLGYEMVGDAAGAESSSRRWYRGKYGAPARFRVAVQIFLREVRWGFADGVLRAGNR